MSRIYNFNAGPATLPLEVLEEAQRQLIDFNGTGMSLLESSHRAKAYDAVHQEAIANLRELLNIPEDYAVLFLQGGASTQFSMVPMNLLPADGCADYIDSGAWSHKAVKEAQKVGTVNIIGNTVKDIPTRMPDLASLRFTPGAAYVHMTSNETIAGAQYKSVPETDAPLVADMSSDILSRDFDITRFGLVYAGAQKNLGPSGVTLVIVKKELVANAPESLPTMLRYQTHIDGNSLYNTPPTFGIYILMLVTRWIKKVGKDNLFRQNVEKAAKLYDAMDASKGFFKGTAEKKYRSDMNVTFRICPDGVTPNEDTEKKFIAEATAAGFAGLKGHRSVGGLRASIYNAFPVKGVDDLVSFMQDFQSKNA